MKRIHHYTSETFRTPHVTSLKRKRKQLHTSCRLCRSRKVACDRQKPCQNCSSLRCGDQCSYAVDEENGLSTAESGLSETPANMLGVAQESTEVRLGRLESLFAKIEKLEAQIDSRTGERNATTQSAEALEKSIGTLSQTSPYANAIVDSNKCPEGSFYIAQHNWTKPFGQDMKYFWENRISFANHYANMLSHMGHFDSDRRRTLWRFSNVSDTPLTSEADLLALLPDPQICDVAVTRFLRTLNCTHPVVSEVLLREEIAAFRHHSASSPPAWLSLYLAIIGLGLQIPIAISSQDQMLVRGRAQGQALVSTATKYAIHVAQELRRPSIPTFQTLLLAVLQQKVDLDWIDGNDLTCGLTAMLSRMADTMGLHRDPDLFVALGPGVKAEEADLRRMLFWTLTFVEMEHSLQCGTPWRYSEDSHDVSEPQEYASAWSEYGTFVTQCTKVCADLLRMSHSHRVVTPLHSIEQLRHRLSHIESAMRAANAHRYGEVARPHEKLIVAIQRTLLLCIVNRNRTLLYWSVLDSPDVAVRKVAEHAILDIADLMVQDVLSVFTMIAVQNEQDKFAWTHLVVSLLRCFAYNAISLIHNVCRRSTRWQNPGSREADPKHLIRKAQALLTCIDSTVTLSYEMAKHQTLYWTQSRSVEAHVRAGLTCGSSAKDISPETPGGRLIIEATQQSMDTEFQKILNEFDVAKTLADPPPNLLPASQDASPSVMALIRNNNGGTYAQDSDNQFSDWLAEFDDFASSRTMLDDVSASWM